jgi:hypothetical protein
MARQIICTNQSSQIEQELHRFQIQVETEFSAHREVYVSTMELLQQSIVSCQAPHGGLAWPYQVQDSFIDLLKSEDCIAGLLFLFHGLQMHLLWRRWYVRDYGRRLFFGFLPTFAESIPTKWTGLVVWMTQIVNN